MPIVCPRRSALYLPGSNARALEKARTLAADVLILDLEDAVAPAAKAEARRLVVEAVKGGGFGQRELVIRVNRADTPWGADDLVAAAGSGAAAVLLPKVESAGEVRRAEAALRAAGAPARLRLWAMIETPRGVLEAPAIAAASPRLELPGGRDQRPRQGPPRPPDPGARRGAHRPLARRAGGAGPRPRLPRRRPPRPRRRGRLRGGSAGRGATSASTARP